MAGSFDWGSSSKSDGAGTKQTLPRRVERMNMGETPPKMKKSGKSSEGLPWGGQPAEKKKAYATGAPTGKNSVTSRTGERKGSVGSLPHAGKNVGMKNVATSKKK